MTFKSLSNLNFKFKIFIKFFMNLKYKYYIIDMGNDGGSILKRADMVKLKPKDIKVADDLIAKAKFIVYLGQNFVH